MVWGLGLGFFWLKILERGFCGCLKWLGCPENTQGFLLVLVLGRASISPVFQMVVFT